MKQARKTFIDDTTDTNRKVNAARGMAHNDPTMAVKMAEAIAKDVNLLVGLGGVVAGLVKHPRAREILREVFARPGVKAQHKQEYALVCKADANDVFL